MTSVTFALGLSVVDVFGLSMVIVEEDAMVALVSMMLSTISSWLVGVIVVIVLNE